jgi:hypothetical protein
MAPVSLHADDKFLFSTETQIPRDTARQFFEVAQKHKRRFQPASKTTYVDSA